MKNDNAILPERAKSIRFSECSGDGSGIKCESESVSGAVSQRACVYCGARVVLNPITDAFHLVHGPIGCASYTWDIRGSLSSDEEGYRNSYSTDLRETDVIFGGEKNWWPPLMKSWPVMPPKSFLFTPPVLSVSSVTISMPSVATLKQNTVSGSSRLNLQASLEPKKLAITWPVMPS